jgi:hypothetical protein
MLWARRGRRRGGLGEAPAGVAPKGRLNFLSASFSQTALILHPEF